eukprot:5560072-Pyramimonas_sp.AAC.1
MNNISGYHMRLLLGVQRQALGLGVGGRRCEGWKAVCRANFEDAKRLPDKIRYHQTVVQAIERNARKDDANVLDKDYSPEVSHPLASFV